MVKFRIIRHLIIIIMMAFIVTDVSGNQNVRLGVNKLAPIGVDKKTAEDITVKLYKSLKDIKGKEFIFYRWTDGLSKNLNRQLVGRISKLGKTLIISVSVVEGEKANILFSDTVMIKEGDDIQEKLDNIAKKICKDEKIWKLE